MPEVSFILPTRNEVLAIGRLIDEIKVLPFDKEILVIDYKSTDGTREAALRKGVILIDEEEKGKGAALLRGFREAKGRYIITLDADGTYLVKDIPGILSHLQSGLGAVLGWRKYKEQGSMFWGHQLGNFLLSLLASVLYFNRVRDINTGMKGFRRHTLSQLRLTSKDFTIEADIFVRLVRRYADFIEVPIGYKPRVNGSTPKLSILDGFKIGWFLVRSRF